MAHNEPVEKETQKCLTSSHPLNTLHPVFSVYLRLNTLQLKITQRV